MLEISFQNFLDALLEEETHFQPRYLYHLSDLESINLKLFEKTWGQIPRWRQRALLEDLKEMSIADPLLSFEAVGRHAIRDEDPKVRSLAVRILYEYETPDLAPIFLHLIKTDSDADVRAAAATALGLFVNLGETEEISAKTLQDIEDSLLLTIENDKAPLVRRCALEALSFSIRSEVPPLIEKAYISGDIDWMTTALSAMGRSADRRWQEKVMEMLEDRIPTLRAEAARAAGELEISDAVLILMDLTEDVDGDAHFAAIWSLSQIGGEGVRESIEHLLEEAGEDQEIDFLVSALDNLSFTEDSQVFSLSDFPGKDMYTEMLDLLGGDEEFLDFEYNEEGEEFEA
jgi:HEAT repeat protein